MQVIAWTIWIVLVREVGRGSNGARWCLTILAAIEELVSIPAIASGFYRSTVTSVVFAVVSIGIVVVVLLAIIAMHKPNIKVYFQRLT